MGKRLGAMWSLWKNSLLHVYLGRFCMRLWVTDWYVDYIARQCSGIYCLRKVWPGKQLRKLPRLRGWLIRRPRVWGMAPQFQKSKPRQLAVMVRCMQCLKAHRIMGIVGISRINKSTTVLDEGIHVRYGWGVSFQRCHWVLMKVLINGVKHFHQ